MPLLDPLSISMTVPSTGTIQACSPETVSSEITTAHFGSRPIHNPSLSTLKVRPDSAPEVNWMLP